MRENGRMPAQLVQRMRRFGTTIFTEISDLAAAHNAINLGQGAPDTDGPAITREVAIHAIQNGKNQYAPDPGVPELRRAVAEHRERFHGVAFDPDTEVQISAGATEALASSIMALCEPGDEVIVLEPFYDVYPAVVELAQGKLVPARLDAPDFRLDPERLRNAVTDRTRIILINTPHNPTGHALSREELQAVADVAIEHDLVVITDEVYEHLVFDGGEHVSIAALPGMRERTLSISSSGKTFSTTGWKVGWMVGPAHLIEAAGVVKQFLTFSNAHPFQYGIAAGLNLPTEEFHAIRVRLQSQRDVLVRGLEATGMRVFRSEASYFVVGDVAPLGFADSREFCRWLPEHAGVAAIPMSVFYADPTGAETLVRFGFCKRPEVLEEAARRLAAAFEGRK